MVYSNEPQNNDIHRELKTLSCRVQASCLKWGDILFRFSGFREKF